MWDTFAVMEAGDVQATRRNEPMSSPRSSSAKVSTRTDWSPADWRAIEQAETQNFLITGDRVAACAGAWRQRCEERGIPFIWIKRWGLYADICMDLRTLKGIGDRVGLFSVSAEWVAEVE